VILGVQIVPTVKQKGLVMTSLSTVDEKQPMVSRLSIENKVFTFYILTTVAIYMFVESDFG